MEEQQKEEHIAFRQDVSELSSGVWRLVGWCKDKWRRSDHFVGGCNTYSDNAIAAVAAVNDSTAYQLKQQPIPNKMQVPQI